MAHYDHATAHHNKLMQKAFDEFLEFLKTEEGRKQFKDWMLIVEYLSQQKVEIKNQRDEIKKYREFFRTLDTFLPNKNPILY